MRAVYHGGVESPSIPEEKGICQMTKATITPLPDPSGFSLDALEPDAWLADRIRALPGRKIVYTNGSAPYAARVVEKRGLGGLFDALYGVEHAGYRPKPERAAFDAVLSRDGLAPCRAAMFGDEPRNIAEPHALDMRTVHVAPERHDAAHIHHHTDDLGGFLSRPV